MALLNHGSPQPTSAATPRRVTGQYLARAHLNRRQRARLAADLANGTAAIFPLTLRQAADLARVPVLDVSRARRNGKPRVININGRSNGPNQICSICNGPIVGFGNNAYPVNDGRCCDRCNVDCIIPARIARSHAETLAEHIARSSPTERLAAARIIGPAELWDSMISPVVSDERTATEANSTA